MKIFSEKFKTIILGWILLGLLAGNSKMFCVGSDAGFQVSDEELDDIELSFDSNGDDTNNAVEKKKPEKNKEENNDEVLKKKREREKFLLLSLKVVGVLGLAVGIFFLGWFTEDRKSYRAGYREGVRSERSDKGSCVVSEGSYLTLQNNLMDVYNLLPLLKPAERRNLCGGGKYKDYYYPNGNTVLERIRELLGEIREEVDGLTCVF